MMFGWNFATFEVYRAAMYYGALGGGQPSRRAAPIHWFSPCSGWAPTILESACSGLRCLSHEEAMAAGVCRFGLPVAGLVSGLDLVQRGTMSPERWTELCATVAVAGDDPREWFGHVGRLSLLDLIIDKTDGGQWVRLKRMRRVHLAGLVALEEEPLDPDTWPTGAGRQQP